MRIVKTKAVNVVRHTIEFDEPVGKKQVTKFEVTVSFKDGAYDFIHSDSGLERLQPFQLRAIADLIEKVDPATKPRPAGMATDDIIRQITDEDLAARMPFMPSRITETYCMIIPECIQKNGRVDITFQDRRFFDYKVYVDKGDHFETLSDVPQDVHTFICHRVNQIQSSLKK
jgi:hypothetical protein